ncbi:MAG: hypothetical protein HY365_00605 [Candidatus Aenigmarchaeota archaeon]|nr:hypothetical protein [Candidatus Aenigmarchaeota archaeon]
MMVYSNQELKEQHEYLGRLYALINLGTYSHEQMVVALSRRYEGLTTDIVAHDCERLKRTFAVYDMPTVMADEILDFTQYIGIRIPEEKMEEIKRRFGNRQEDKETKQ